MKKWTWKRPEIVVIFGPHSESYEGHMWSHIKASYVQRSFYNKKWPAAARAENTHKCGSIIGF